MPGSSTGLRRVILPTIAVVITLASPRLASAQAFISPFIGYNFGGDAGCPEITQCDNKNLNWGVSLGATNSIVGAELDLGYVGKFYGDSAQYDSSVLTFMGNFLLAPRFGPIQPYGLFGVGLIKSTTDLTLAGGAEETSNDFGWDAGGGVMVHFSQHVGIRGDVRYFYTFDATRILNLGFLDSEQKLDFGRVSGAIVFRF